MEKKVYFSVEYQKEPYQEERKMRILAEDTAALFIDFQEKLVPAIANNE